MPKSQQERNTSNPLGQKINALMREKGIAGDYAAIARAFDVKTPSVYDWIDHGRLGKDRYLALVKWSGRRRVRYESYCCFTPGNLNIVARCGTPGTDHGAGHLTGTLKVRASFHMPEVVS